MQTWLNFHRIWSFFGFAFRLQCRPKHIFSKDWKSCLLTLKRNFSPSRSCSTGFVAVQSAWL
jgi:hypothetical protein